MTIKVAVIGAAGRMGQHVCAAIQASNDTELVRTIERGDDLGDLGGARVAVDFTVPEATVANVSHCVKRGVHAVVGTTGWTPERLRSVEDDVAQAPGVGVLIAPNFAIGAVLAMKFSAIAARHFESAEVVELHHPDKQDAPSGTATRTAQLIAAARRDSGVEAISPDATTSQVPGARGADIDGVRVHAVRLRGLVAHQEVLFGGVGETFTIRHDSYDRASFMPGVLLGIRTVASRPGVTVGLENYLDE